MGPQVKQGTESYPQLIEATPVIEPASGYDEGVPGTVGRDKFSEWFWLLWDHKSFLFRVAAWGLAVSLIIAFVIPKRYQSTTRLMPPDAQSGSGLAMVAAMAGKTGGGLGSLAGDLLGMKSSGALFVDILGGRTVQDRVIDRFNLLKVYGVRYRQDARKILAERTAVSEDRKSGVITITTTDRDPHRAAEIAQAYVDELDRLVAQVSTSSARRERMFIEQRLQTVKADLDSASQKFSEYASKNTAIDITAQGKAMVEAAARLEGESIAAQSELQGLEQIYSNNNVRVRSARARVDELKRQLQKMGGDNSTSSSTGAQSDFPSIRQLPLLGVRWADLYRQTKIEETVYELLTQQYELAKIQEAKEIPTVKVLDPADVPEKKSFPPRLLIGVLGALLSSALACTWVMGRYTWMRLDPADPRKLFAQELLATLRSDRQRIRERSHNLDVILTKLGWRLSPKNQSQDRN